ncbi:hypothetical protein [Dryocola sp. LX212]|jgi:DNA-binding NarL/FixJ family response regulator
MKFDVISDNYFYCEGIKSSQNQVHYVLDHEDVNLFFASFTQTNHLIIALRNMHLRGVVIEFCRANQAKYVVLLEDMIKNDWFEIDNVIYFSMDSSQQHIRKIITSPIMSKGDKLTQRELDILPHVHLNNTTMASMLNLSQKTASGYKIILKRKLKMKAFNSLALTRMKNAIMCTDTEGQRYLAS